jgi:hypothetical protein
VNDVSARVHTWLLECSFLLVHSELMSGRDLQRAAQQAVTSVVGAKCICNQAVAKYTKQPTDSASTTYHNLPVDLVADLDCAPISRVPTADAGRDNKRSYALVCQNTTGCSRLAVRWGTAGESRCAKRECPNAAVEMNPRSERPGRSCFLDGCSACYRV